MSNNSVNIDNAYRKKFKLTRFWHVLVVLWLAYTSYTMIRRPFSVARVEIERDVNVTTPELSLVDTSFTATYSIAQLFYGVFKAHLSYYNILLIGLYGSSLSCIFLALSPNLWCLILSWGLNGIAQGTGWASCLAILHTWVLPSERGRVMGWWSTNMAIGGVAGNVLPAWLIGRGYSWRTATIIEVFVGPAAMGLITGWALRSNPNQCNLPSVQQLEQGLSVEVVRSLEKVGMTADGEFIFASPLASTTSEEELPEVAHTTQICDRSSLANLPCVNSTNAANEITPSSRFVYEKELPLTSFTLEKRSEVCTINAGELSPSSQQSEPINHQNENVHFFITKSKDELASTSQNISVSSLSKAIDSKSNNIISNDDNVEINDYKKHLSSNTAIPPNALEQLHNVPQVVNKQSINTAEQFHSSTPQGERTVITNAEVLLPVKEELMPMWTILSFPGAIGYSISYFINKLVRYALMFWLPYYLSKEIKTSTEVAGYVASMFDVGGAIGIVVSGYCADRCYKGKRRVLVLLECTAILAIIACALGLLESIFAEHLWLCVVLIFLVGAFSAAVECLQSGSCLLCYCEAVHAPVAAMSGVIGGIGSIGSVLQGSCSIVIEYSSWSVLFTAFGIITVISGVCMIRPFFIELAELSAPEEQQNELFK